MKKITAFLLIAIIFLSGCTFNVDVLTPAPPSTPLPTQIIASSVPSPVATISATAEPATAIPSPTLTAPLFTGAFFVPDSGDSQNGRIFSAGTKQVFVVWNYLNMRDGMKVKREWYLNGQLWLTREEQWDFAKYGANGAMPQDISIYDLDNGLPTGIYELRMYIDGVIQPIGLATASGEPNTKATFDIRSADEAQAGNTSPDFQWSVEVFGEQRIVLEDQTGNPKTIFTAREVPYVVWFSDSKHFLFVDRDRSAQKPGTSLGIRDDLWIVEVPSGATQLLYKSDTSFARFAGPVPSFDGKYIASLEGSGYSDACMIDSHLIFFQAATDFKSVKVIKQEEFSGLPSFNESWIYPVEDGTWQTDNTYLVTLDGTCNADKSQLGPFIFNPATLTATKK